MAPPHTTGTSFLLPMYIFTTPLHTVSGKGHEDSKICNENLFLNKKIKTISLINRYFCTLSQWTQC